MQHRVLVVEDNRGIIEPIIDTLESLGHEYVWVECQADARTQIREGGFTYALLDLQIPVHLGQGFPNIEHGVHLIQEIHASPTMQGVPLIVMTAFACADHRVLQPGDLGPGPFP